MNRQLNQQNRSMVRCSKCDGTKRILVESKQEVYEGLTYGYYKFETCCWCNNDGMVDWVKEIMGKKYYEY